MLEVSAKLDLKGQPQKLRAYEGYVKEELDAFMKERAYAVRDEAKRYEAPEKPGYHRTGEMSRKTVAYRDSAGTGWIAEMRAPYSVYVRGSKGRRQAWMHVGRWTSWADIVKRQFANTRRQITDLLARAKRKAGLQ